MNSKLLGPCCADSTTRYLELLRGCWDVCFPTFTEVLTCIRTIEDVFSCGFGKNGFCYCRIGFASTSLLEASGKQLRDEPFIFPRKLAQLVFVKFKVFTCRWWEAFFFKAIGGMLSSHG